jgi:hypothetical protein
LPLNVKERVPLSGNDIIVEYFKCIDKKDVEGALELFDFDAVVFEPFSNIGDGLKGKRAIEPFLKVAMMASTNFKRVIDFEDSLENDNRITALVTFERGDKTSGRFTFEFTPNGPQREKKIRALHIEF